MNEKLMHMEGLKKFRNDFNNPKLSLWNFIKFKSDFDLAFAFCKLFFPEFVQIEGCIFLAEHYKPEVFQEWKKTVKGNNRMLESTINHTHIYDLFESDDETEEVSVEICEEIAKYIAKSWAVALKEAFPQKQFDIHFSSEPDDYGPTITFFQTDPETL